MKDTLGQAIAYICPLQRELNMHPIVNKVSMKLIRTYFMDSVTSCTFSCIRHQMALEKLTYQSHHQ